MISRLLMIAAGLSGAAGIATAAAAAHADASNLSASSTMFLAHAPALLAIGLTGSERTRVIDYAGLVLLAGLILFCGDLLARQYLGGKLFSFAAPTGGFLMIVGWLAVGAGSLASRR